jgi:protein transport protein DSL1/ZW10
VRSWVNNATSLQADIQRTKALANDIVKQANAPVASGKALQDAESRAEFLVRELRYNGQVREALRGIKQIGQTLDQAETARDERRILDALRLLESAWNQMDALAVSKSCKAIRLLDIRAFELKTGVHSVLDGVWNALVHVDLELGSFTVNGSLPDEFMTLADAVVGLRAYKELDKKMELLWHQLDASIIAPRMSANADSLSTLSIQDGALKRAGTADRSTQALLTDLEVVFRYLAQELPSDLVDSLTSVLMPDLTARLISVWLEPAVPSSLQNMDDFQGIIANVKAFCDTLHSLNVSRTEDLLEWAQHAPRVWLTKCKENALDTVRLTLANGLGTPKEVERIERQMVSRSEGNALTANTTAVQAESHDWDAEWSDEEVGQSNGTSKQTMENNPAHDAVADGADADAWGWGEDEESTAEVQQNSRDQDGDVAMDDEDDTEAWGWGGENDADQQQRTSEGSITGHRTEQGKQGEGGTRELVLKESYNVSSLPEPLLTLLAAIVEDGAALTKDDHANSPVAAAAAGLFSLPTLVLAMFRAVSPYYYSLDLGGSMFLYNDATYLADRLASFASSWKERGDLNSRAKTMLRIDHDVKALQGFAGRAYSNEMNVQKTILRDLLGGEQNVVQQEEAKSSVDAAVARVRSMAVTWESILAKSAWYQAVGSLVDTVASKFISDVMDMTAIGQDEAYSIAKLIATVTELDDLFLPSRSGHNQGGPGPDMVPTTAQYATSWLRLKYLSEILQSNLRDVRYLWVESELSLYFSMEEVIDLINMSFEDNPRTREVIREITHNPHPVHQL